MNEDLMIEKIVTLEADMKDVKERLDRVETNTESILSGQDKMIGILQRIDQERAFTNHRMERFESDLSMLKAKVK